MDIQQFLADSFSSKDVKSLIFQHSSTNIPSLSNNYKQTEEQHIWQNELVEPSISKAKKQKIKKDVR